jgi:uncharacterized protein YdeI (YjbR/CyaY-like superfamily)
VASADELPRFQPETRAAWRAWLTEHGATEVGVWVITFKRSTGKASPTYDDLVEECLCFGWVDSKSKGLDDERTMLLVTPRKPGSGWSRPNKLRIEKLSAAGALRPAGLAVIDTAKTDGSWTLLDTVEALEPPPDLVAALAASPAAEAAWHTFSASAQKQLLLWLVTAKKPETRAARIAETVRQAADGKPARS